MGTFSYQFLAKFPSARIVAIEPQPQLAEMVRDNLSAVHHDRHEVFEVALGSVESVMELGVPDGNRGAATLLPEMMPSGVDSLAVTVKIVPAEWILERSEFGLPTLVKIDVQGYESVALQSLQDAFRTGTARAVVFEYGETLGDTWSDIQSLFEEAGYRIYAIRRDPFRTWLEHTPRPVQDSNDYAAVRADLLPDRSPDRIPIPRSRTTNELSRPVAAANPASGLRRR